MTGKELFDKYTAPRDDYARLLMTMRMSVGDKIYPLLEKAEKEGKKLDVTPEPEDRLRDELTPADIILV